VADDVTAKWPPVQRPSGHTPGADPPNRARAAPRPAGGRHWREWVSELLGTAILFGVGFSAVAVLVSPRSPVADHVAGVRFLLVGLTFGVLSGLIAVSPLGRRSGAHLNPAVTLAFWLRGHVHPHDLGGYFAAQFLGALVGTGLFALALGSWATSIHHARTSPAPVGSLAGIAIEAALTLALLVTVFLALGARRLMRWTPLFAGAALTALIWVGSPPTGASLNPARSLAPAVLERQFADLWVYFAGPVAGAVAAALLTRACRLQPLTTKLFHDTRDRSSPAAHPTSASARARCQVEPGSPFQEAVTANTAVKRSPGATHRRSSPLTNAFPGAVIGSNATTSRSMGA
jgi:aquaporin Z